MEAIEAQRLQGILQDATYGRDVLASVERLAGMTDIQVIGYQAFALNCPFHHILQFVKLHITQPLESPKHSHSHHRQHQPDRFSSAKQNETQESERRAHRIKNQHRFPLSPSAL